MVEEMAKLISKGRSKLQTNLVLFKLRMGIDMKLKKIIRDCSFNILC